MLSKIKLPVKRPISSFYFSLYFYKIRIDIIISYRNVFCGVQKPLFFHSPSFQQDLIHVKSNYIQKWIYVEKIVFYVNNSNHNQNQNIDNRHWNVFQFKRNCKQNKQRKIWQKVFPRYVFEFLYAHLLNFSVCKCHKNAQQPQKDQQKIETNHDTVCDIEWQVVIDYVNKLFHYDQKIKRNKTADIHQNLQKQILHGFSIPKSKKIKLFKK